jgi:hypothetical protein
MLGFEYVRASDVGETVATVSADPAAAYLAERHDPTRLDVEGRRGRPHSGWSTSPVCRCAGSPDATTRSRSGR